jgi:hypothetical protein
MVRWMVIGLLLLSAWLLPIVAAVAAVYQPN